MVERNSDLILEVPDTPDRIRQSTCLVSGSSSKRGIAKVDPNPLPSRRIVHKSRNDAIQGQSCQGNASSVTTAPSDTDHFFRQAALAQLLSGDLETNSSSPKTDRTTKISIENGKRTNKFDLNQSSSLSRDTGGRRHSCQIREIDGAQLDGSYQNSDFLGVGAALPSIPVGRPRSKTGTSASNRLREVACADFCASSSFSEDKGEVITTKGAAALSNPPLCVPQSRAGQRKLVRNGCISPSNIAKRGLKVDEKQERSSTIRVPYHSNPQVDVLEKRNVIDLIDNSPTITNEGNSVNDGLISVNKETRAAKKLRTVRIGEMAGPKAAHQVNHSACSNDSLSGRNNKGKEIIHDVVAAKQTGETNLRRVRSRVAGDSSVANNDSTGVSSDDQGWTTTHNHTSNLPMPLLWKTASSRGGESGSVGPFSLNCETAAGDNNNSTSGEPSLEIRRTRVGRGKRKHGSSSYHPGESSTSLCEPKSHVPSNTTFDRSHTTHHYDIPIVEIDDICSPEVRFIGSRGPSNGTSIDPNTAAQLESDKLLALQLQEQFYNESPRVIPTEEIDAIIAMSLQHEEETQRTSRVVRRHRNNTRGARTSRSSASQYATRDGYETTSSLRAGNATRFPSASRIQPNIDLNDYDALLALDDNNHQHAGASESQINILPQSVVQSNSIQEPCAVCLENPSVGDTIRHLRCFHKFHKECIDEWLRRKKLCPVCKCGIS